jgi:Carboxypeptidase regulatory-like domain
MGKFLSAALVVALMALGMPAVSFASGPTAPRKQDQPGTVAGKTKDSKGDVLPNAKVRVRKKGGALLADATSNTAGDFSVSVPQGEYFVEILDGAGKVIGLSPTLTVAAGQTATITVTAAAVGAVAGGTAAAGGFSLFGLGTAATVGVIAGATTAGVLSIRAVTNDASPSK